MRGGQRSPEVLLAQRLARGGGGGDGDHHDGGGGQQAVQVNQRHVHLVADGLRGGQSVCRCVSVCEWEGGAPRRQCTVQEWQGG
jgi:hypothetical protein